jgi:sulfite dehydrogenase (cytochrome) subunit B
MPTSARGGLRSRVPRGNAKQWDAVVTKMIKVFGAPLSDHDATTIVEYLATQYGN